MTPFTPSVRPSEENVWVFSLSKYALGKGACGPTPRLVGQLVSQPADSYAGTHHFAHKAGFNCGGWGAGDPNSEPTSSGNEAPKTLFFIQFFIKCLSRKVPTSCLWRILAIFGTPPADDGFILSTTGGYIQAFPCFLFYLCSAFWDRQREGIRDGHLRFT
jgi:hypothetical protein